MVEPLFSQYIQHQYSNKELVIVGMGREGISTYQVLRAALPGHQISIFDDKPLGQLEETTRELLSSDSNSSYFSQDNSAMLLFSANSVVFKTPGIPATHRIIAKAISAQASVTSNTALFFESLSQLPKSPLTIGITGTKGKSTTTSLIHHVLQAAGKTVLLAGNIGVPALTLLDTISAATASDLLVVLELSSHQLQDLQHSPQIAVIQNVTPEHLDYYLNFDQYLNAKNAIAQYQNEKNVIIYSPDFAASADIASLSKAATRYTFSLNPTNPASVTAYATDQAVFYKEEKIMDVSQIPLVGSHNLLNVLPSILIAKHLGIDSETIRSAISKFTALPHRLEYVATNDQVRYFNDSQATTPEAAIAALRSFPLGKVHLLAGGSDKGVELTEFAQEILHRKVKTVLLFAPMGNQIAALLEKAAVEQNVPLPTLLPVDSMQEAVQQAVASAEAEDVVLLSPACASFGLFKNYQDRGDQFKAAVNTLS